MGPQSRRIYLNIYSYTNSIYMWNKISSTFVFYRKKSTPRYWLYFKKYWSSMILRYEYRDIKVCSNIFRINSYIISQNELELGIFRNLEVDKRIVLPYETQLKLLVTRADVIHS